MQSRFYLIARHKRKHKKREHPHSRCSGESLLPRSNVDQQKVGPERLLQPRPRLGIEAGGAGTTTANKSRD